MTVLLRGDFDATQLRGFAKKTKDGPQARRLLALAAIYDGARRTEAAKIGGVGLQIIRDWVMRFNARGPDGLLDGKSPGQPPKLNDEQRHAIARLIESGPIPSVHRVVRHATMRKPREQSRILKNFPARLDEVARETAIDSDKIEIWFADEARIGQKNMITRRWAKRSSRPSAPRDQRTASTYIFGAICPKGQGRSPDPAGLQYRGDEPSSDGNRQNRFTRIPRRPSCRSGRMASVGTIGRSNQYHHHPPPAEIP